MIDTIKLSLIATALTLNTTVMADTTSTNKDLTYQEDRETSFRKSIDAFGKIEPKSVTGVGKFKQIFINATLSGQVRSMYAGYDQKKVGEINTHATALGGMLKYELANFNGFNAGFALSGSQDLDFATGDKTYSKQNPELSSPKGSYATLSEAYINYANDGLNIRLGRQMIDTPLADTDDIRMVPNTFEAYMLTYDYNNLIFTLGNVQKWQGADAGLGYDDTTKLSSKWIDTEGTTMIGLSYDDEYKFNAWHYDIQKTQNATQASYFDIGYHHQGDISLHVSLQYLKESEKKNSNVAADIYGALAELVIYDLNINAAYNKSKKHTGKRSFSGIGGGSLYTSMDTMILDEITEDREASALVFGLEYNYDTLKVIYAYGDFDAKADSTGVKAHIIEQDLGLEYSINDAFSLAAIYVKSQDKQSAAKTTNDWDRAQFMATYNF